MNNLRIDHVDLFFLVLFVFFFFVCFLAQECTRSHITTHTHTTFLTVTLHNIDHEDDYLHTHDITHLFASPQFWTVPHVFLKREELLSGDM